MFTKMQPAYLTSTLIRLGPWQLCKGGTYLTNKQQLWWPEVPDCTECQGEWECLGVQLTLSDEPVEEVALHLGYQYTSFGYLQSFRGQLLIDFT